MKKNQSLAEFRMNQDNWRKIVLRSSSIILSQRILWSPDVKVIKPKKNAKSFHFPEVNIIESPYRKVYKYTRKEDAVSLSNEYYLDLYVEDEIELDSSSSSSSLEEDPYSTPKKKRTIGLLAQDFKKMAKRTRVSRILERWRFTKQKNQYEEVHRLKQITYTRSVILMRSLFSYVLLLPCFELFRLGRLDRKKYLHMKFRFYDAGEVAKYHYENSEDLVCQHSFSKIHAPLFSMGIRVDYVPNIQHAPSIPYSDRQLPTEEDLYEDDFSPPDLMMKPKEHSNQIPIAKKSPKMKNHRRVVSRDLDTFEQTPPLIYQASTSENSFGGYASSYGRTPPFSFKKPSSVENKRLSFSPFNSPTLVNYTCPYPEDDKTETEEVRTSSEVEFSISDFSPPGEDEPGTSENLVELSPAFLKLKLGKGESPESPKTTGSSPDEDSGLAFLDYDEQVLFNADDKEEDIGGLLKMIDNAPMLDAFLDEDGDVKATPLGKVLQNLTDAARLKKEIVSTKI